MKTQLLEDIGQSATLSLTPSNTAGNSTADKAVHKHAPAGSVEPAMPRSTPGIWRQKPAGDPLISTAREPDAQPTPLDLNSVFEEIAALEAQYVPPGRQDAPAVAAVEPERALPASPAEPPHQPAVPADDATLVRNPAHSAAARQDPLFDFTLPLPAPQAADPFTLAPTGPARSRQRYLLWAACLLSVALLILGGRWLYQERSDAGSLARIADEAKVEPQADKAMKRPAVVAKEFTPEPEAGARSTPFVPASDPLPAAPPLVLLEPEPVAEGGPASPLPTPSSRTAREQSGTAAKPATERGEREPVRQLARASANQAKRPPERDSTMAATLKACREHGYHAAQCIKRSCSVTEYGFVCRGR